MPNSPHAVISATMSPAAAATDSDLPGRVSHSHRIRISLSLLPHVGLSFIYDRQLSSMPWNGNWYLCRHSCVLASCRRNGPVDDDRNVHGLGLLRPAWSSTNCLWPPGRCCAKRPFYIGLLRALGNSSQAAKAQTDAVACRTSRVRQLLF